MIDVGCWPTPNGHKILIFLEESGLPYRICVGGKKRSGGAQQPFKPISLRLIWPRRGSIEYTDASQPEGRGEFRPFRE